jgi:hypothetical protein
MKYRIYMDEVGNPDLESRNEILAEQGLRADDLAPFAQRVVAVLQTKYDRVGDRMVGKKLL